MKARAWILPAAALLLCAGLWTLSDIRISRQVVVAAPASEVQPWLENLECWQEWSPWMQEDPSLSVELSRPAVGAGAHLSWISAGGSGRLALLACPAGRGVTFEVRFDDEDTPWRGRLALRETKDGTRLRWSLEGPRQFYRHGPSYAGLVEAGVGPMMEAGLEQLKALVEGR